VALRLVPDGPAAGADHARPAKWSSAPRSARTWRARSTGTRPSAPGIVRATARVSPPTAPSSPGLNGSGMMAETPLAKIDW